MAGGRCARCRDSLYGLKGSYLHREATKRRLKYSEESGAIPLYNDDQAMGGMSAEEMEQDLIEGVDEEGNKVLLEVVRYFFYNGDEYVVLGDAQLTGGCDEGCEHCEHRHEDDDNDEEDAISLYIMKVVKSEEDGEEMEEFVPVEDEDLLEKLIEIVQADFDNEESLED